MEIYPWGFFFPHQGEKLDIGFNFGEKSSKYFGCVFYYFEYLAIKSKGGLGIWGEFKKEKKRMWGR